jgi:hypothetical protein
VRTRKAEKIIRKKWWENEKNGRTFKKKTLKRKAKRSKCTFM